MNEGVDCVLEIAEMCTGVEKQTTSSGNWFYFI